MTSYNLEETILRGKIPLSEIEKKLAEGWGINKIDYTKNGYCNDGVLQCIQTKKKKKLQYCKEIILDGCTQITSSGIHCITQLMESATNVNIVLDGCSELGDDDLAFLLKCSVRSISMKGTSVRHLSHPDVKFNVNTDGCHVLTGMEPLVDINYSHVIAVHQKSYPCCSMIDLMKSKKDSSINGFKHVTNFPLKNWKLTLSELDLDHPLFDVLISSHPVQIIVPFHADKGTIEDIKKNIQDTIMAVVSKAACTAEYPKQKEPEKEKTEENEEEEKKEEEKGKKEEEEKKEEEPVRKFRECEFILVQIGNNPKQLEQLQELLMKEDLFKDTMESIDKNIEYHEQHFADMDIVEQNVYGRLSQFKEKLARFNSSKEDRLHFISINTKPIQGVDKLLDKMTEILNCRKYHQEIRYKIASKYEKQLKVVMETVKKEEIVDLSLGMTTKSQINGEEFRQISKLLHEQGRILIFNICSKTVLVDVEYLKNKIDKLKSTSMSQTKDYQSLAVQKNDNTITIETITKVLELKDDPKSDLLMKILQDYCGLIELPVLRTESTDKQNVYIWLDKLKDPPPFSLETYYSEEKPSNCVVLQKTYSFVHAVTKDLLPSLISSAAGFGRTLLVTRNGASFQIGCVQTVIKNHQTNTGNDVIRLQAKCYLHDKKAEVIDGDTEMHVKEYTWNIFCLYTDLAEKLLKQRNVIYQSEGEVPKGFVNNSFGCKHKWKQIKGKYNQSVCTICNKCCEKGRKCEYNGIMGDHYRECMCKTSMSGCADCGICVSCTTELWELRSYLRPQLTCAYLETRRSPSSHAESIFNHIPLDPVAYNEVEFQIFKRANLGTFLKEAEDGTVITVFPGKANIVSATDAMSESKIAERFKALEKEETQDPMYKLDEGDTIKIRITDPFGAMTKKKKEELDLSEVKESKVVYNYYVCRELKISQETGLLVFQPSTKSVPVGQFIGAEPFSSTLKTVSFKIINSGRKRSIGIGVCSKNYGGNAMPGWRKESFGYHADDGKIYKQSGSSQLRFATCSKDDVMSVYCDPDKNEISFFKNDRLIYTVPPEEVQVPTKGFYPIVSLHSKGECVKLLDKEPWAPKPHQSLSKLASFDTYKYGNMWISPTKTLILKQEESGVTHLNGWIILHNPTKGLIAYQINPGRSEEVPDIGYLGPNESNPLHVWRDPTDSEGKAMLIEWLALDQIKDYKAEELQQLFQDAPDNRKYSHSINLVMMGVASTDENLPQFSSSGDQDGYKLEVFKNSTLVDAYLLKRGRYVADFMKWDTNAPEYQLKRPKCPSFLYPPVLQKEMKVVLASTTKSEQEREGEGEGEDNTPLIVSTTKVIETVVKHVAEDGRVTYCTDDDGLDDNDETKYHMVTNEELKDFEKQRKTENATIELYKDEQGNDLLLKRQIPAPPYLLTKASASLYQSIDTSWKKNMINLFSSCSRNITQATVQEQFITVHSRHLYEWLHSNSSSTNLPCSLVYLPSNLDTSKLMFPTAMNVFEDLSMHRLCCVYDELLERYYSKQKGQLPRIKLLHDPDVRRSVSVHDGSVEKTYPLKNAQEVSLHFMNLPGFPMSKDLPVDYSFANMYLAWNYVALLSKKLSLPATDKILTEDGNKLQKSQVESMMFHLLQSFASLCCIYATQHGGLSNQTYPDDLDTWIKNICGEQLSVEKAGAKMISDEKMFVAFDEVISCKAHACSHGDLMITPDYSLDSKFFTPYSTFCDSLMIRNQKLNSLPSDLLTMLNNLRIVSISNIEMKGNLVFPVGVASCKNLDILCLSNLNGLNSLPKDIISGPCLSTFYLYNCPVKKLDFDWPADKCLTSLTLKGLLVDEIPVGIGKLKELRELNLDFNPITTLPKEIESLNKLKHLSVKGIPWIAFEGKYEEMSKALYLTWHKENPYIVNNLSEKEVDQMFHECDTNNNDVLDKMELARLNLHFLFKIPRLGNQLLGNKDLGGIPSVIFKLPYLETLDLSYTAITNLPGQAREVLPLQTIILEHCPLLEGIDADVGLLPNLRSLRLNSCPSLETPPQDIVGRGFEAVRSFLQKMAGGFTECNRTKLMFIGLGQAGKTTLLRALQTTNKKYTGTVPKLTDGIIIKDWIVPANKDGQDIDIRYSCWDFAGQTVYYNTHQFFLSKQAVYMLLWNMRMGFEHAGLDFWLSSIACHCPNAPVIVVGTQLDQIPMPDIREDELMKKYPQIKKFCYVSSTQGTNIKELEETLIDVTLDFCPQMKMKIPLLWLRLEESIMTARKHRNNIIGWDKVKEFANEHGLNDERDIKLAIQFLDDLGIVQYFDTEILQHKVVINPQWIVDVMAKVVSVNEKVIKENKGRFYHKFIATIWKDYDESLHEWMLKLTEAFDLTFPIPEHEGEKINVVPCLLPEKEPVDLPWPYLSDDDGDIRESKILYKFTYLPTGLFNRAQARLFSQGFMMSQEFLDLMWKRGSILKKNDHYALVKQISDYEMVVTVQGARPKNILDLIHETISTLIKDSFQGVDYDFYIPCPDCLARKGTRDPFLFKADLISRAHNVNAPFLQCTKYFHTVSIGELMSLLPDNKDTEFDVQMQQSISALQEISSNMAKDVAILYSPDDLPTVNQIGKMVDPRQIYADLEKAGFKCWIPDDINNTPELEMTMEIKSSKVLVVCMSEKFVRHPKSRQMFLYASEQLKKPFAIAVIDNTLDFQQTDLGFKIGIPKMAMIKNMERYPKKIYDLIDIVRDYVLDAEKTVVNHPPVFISYCWTNSKEACNETTVPKEGSLGYGDPRALKKHFEKNGIKCWLDIEQMGKLGLYQDITLGLQHSKVTVVCVSDEYLDSEPCMMEARFAAYNLQMPMVVCVVGTGKAWKMSEVSLMVSKQGELATVVKMQKEVKGVYNQAMEQVQNYLNRPETEKQRKIREKLAKIQAREEKLKKEDLEKKLQQQGDTRFSFQEEIELIQRKFLRHITKMTRKDELSNSLPKLLVFDFLNTGTDTPAPQKRDEIDEENETSNDSSFPTSSFSLGKRLKRKASHVQKMVESEDDWKDEQFCIRALCEDEQGWHLVGDPLMLAGYDKDEINKALKNMAPYLTRIYAILQQSAISLNCMNSRLGELYLDYIRKEGIETKNFSESYKMILRLVAEHEDHEPFVNQLNRCYHQTGKISWMCSSHHNKAGITLLPAGTVSIHGSEHLLFEEDVLLAEYLQDSKAFLEWKGEGSLHSKKSRKPIQDKKTPTHIKPIIVRKEETKKEEISQNNKADKPKPTVIEKTPEHKEKAVDAEKEAVKVQAPVAAAKPATPQSLEKNADKGQDKEIKKPDDSTKSTTVSNAETNPKQEATTRKEEKRPESGKQPTAVTDSNNKPSKTQKTPSNTEKIASPRRSSPQKAKNTSKTCSIM